MTEPWEWEEGNLIDLVDNGASESLVLDFKECAALQKTDGRKAELSKDVSAFANSAGGTLVYGVVEDGERHVAARLDAGYDPGEISQEWLDQVIHSNIQPRLSGVRVKAVPLATSSPGRVAYVVYVPQSATAHQASDKRYYKRFNFQSVPMEDYEVRDVMQRANAPSLSVLMTIEGSTEGEAAFSVDQDSVVSPRILVTARNDDYAGAAEYCQFQFFVPEDLSPVQPQAFLLLSSGQVSVTSISSLLGTNTVVNALEEEIGYRYFEVHFGPGQLPFFPGEMRNLVNVGLRVPIRLRRMEHFVLWRVRASRAEPVVGAFVLRARDLGTWRYWNEASFQRLEELGARVVLAP